MPTPSSSTRSTARASTPLGRSYEIIFVLDGPHEKFAAGLKRLAMPAGTASRSSA